MKIDTMTQVVTTAWKRQINSNVTPITIHENRGERGDRGTGVRDGSPQPQPQLNTEAHKRVNTHNSTGP